LEQSGSGGCNYFKWCTDNEIEEKGWGSQKIEEMGGGKLEIEEKGGLSIKNVEGCGANMNAEYTAGVRSVVVEEMEKCMKSIENRLSVLTGVIGVLCVSNIIVMYLLVTNP